MDEYIQTYYSNQKDEETEKIEKIEKIQKGKQPNVYKIKLNNDTKAKVVFMLIKKGKSISKAEIEKVVNDLAIKKIDEEFKRLNSE